MAHSYKTQSFDPWIPHPRGGRSYSTRLSGPIGASSAQPHLQKEEEDKGPKFGPQTLDPKPSPKDFKKQAYNSPFKDLTAALSVTLAALQRTRLQALYKTSPQGLNPKLQDKSSKSTGSPPFDSGGVCSMGPYVVCGI